MVMVILTVSKNSRALEAIQIVTAQLGTNSFISLYSNEEEAYVAAL